MASEEENNESIVDRAALFTAAEPSSVSAKLNPLASIQQFFDLKKDVKTQTDVNDTAADAFNLFSTSSAPAKISLDEATYEVPLVNRKRPHECYFTSHDDKERLSKLNAVAISGSEIVEMSTRPWAAKRNPRLVIRIPTQSKGGIKKRRKPSKKERDYKKKVEVEAEKQAREEKRYGQFLKFGQGNRGGGRGGRGRGGRAGFRGRGHGKS